jgi:hypothetical protein
MKKWLGCSCTAVIAVCLFVAAGLSWFFLSVHGQLLQRERACSDGNAAACLDAANGRRQRDEIGRALEHLGRACSLGIDSACGEMAEATVFGAGLEQAPATSQAFLEQACESGTLRKRLALPVGLLACRRLGRAAAEGREVTRDTRLASELLDLACAEGDAVSCVERARMTLDGPDAAARRAKLWATACHLGGRDGVFPLVLHLMATRSEVNGVAVADEQLAGRLGDILGVREDKTLRVLWEEALQPPEPADLARVTWAVRTANASGASPVFLLGEFEGYAAAIAEACAAAGEPSEFPAPPPPPPPAP